MTGPSPAPRSTVLVAGTGSIGARHIVNLLDLGAAVLTYSYRQSPGAAEWRDRVRAFPTLDEALAAGPDAVVVANRTDQHLEVALPAARAGLALYLEKPLSHTLNGVADLASEAAARGLIVESGFMLRFHPNLIWLKGYLDRGELGEVHYVRALVGQYLPDWRPGQDHRQSYSAKRGSGGVIFDLVHELDVVGWMFGPIEEIHAMTRFAGSLEIESEAVAQIGIRTESGVLAQVHMDYLRPVYGRSLEVVGSRGVLAWDYTVGTVSLTDRDGTRILHQVPSGFARNDIFVAHMRHFLGRVAGSAQPAGSSLQDGIDALRAALACHASAAERRVVRPRELAA